jgi:hypothetical protein
VEGRRDSYPEKRGDDLICCDGVVPPRRCAEYKCDEEASQEAEVGRKWLRRAPHAEIMLCVPLHVPPVVSCPSGIDLAQVLDGFLVNPTPSVVSDVG